MANHYNKTNVLSYKNPEGETVYTSAYLKKRGTCCKTNCLHCPYGFTLKNYAIELMEIKPKYIQFANEIIADSRPVELSDVTRSLLESAYGKYDSVNFFIN